MIQIWKAKQLIVLYIFSINNFHARMIATNFDEFQDALPFTELKADKVHQQRAIYQFYGNSDRNFSRKSKSQLFTRQNLIGFFSTLDLKTSALPFLNQEDLGSQINVFMQHSEIEHKSPGDDLSISENEVILILKGSVFKNTAANSTSLAFAAQIFGDVFSQRKKSKRLSRAEKKLSACMSGIAQSKLSMKVNFKKHQVLETDPPHRIKHEYLDRKPYECLTEVSLFRSQQSYLNKLESFIEISQKQQLVNFISLSLGIDSNRRVLKMLPSISIQTLPCKSIIRFIPSKLYLIIMGQLLLRQGGEKNLYLKRYSIINKNSVTCEDYAEQAIGQIKEKDTMIVSFDEKTLSQCFKQFEPDVYDKILSNLEAIERKRNTVFDTPAPPKQPPLKQPIIDSNAFQIKMVHHDKIISRKSHKSDGKGEKHQSTHFNNKDMILGEFASQEYIDPNCSKFLSRFPFEKIVESYNKIEEKKLYYEKKNTNTRRSSERKTESQFQKAKGEKEVKHLFYMNKVRRLKIRNIAEKTIPNGHKREFDVKKAEKHLTDASLFSTFIEFPINGSCQEPSIQEASQKRTSKMALTGNFIRSNSKCQSQQKGAVQMYKTNLNSKRSSNSLKKSNQAAPTLAQSLPFENGDNKQNSLLIIQQINKQNSMGRITTQYSNQMVSKYMRFSTEMGQEQEEKDRESKAFELSRLIQTIGYKNSKQEKNLNPNEEFQQYRTNNILALTKKAARRPLTSFTHSNSNCNNLVEQG